MALGLIATMSGSLEAAGPRSIDAILNGNLEEEGATAELATAVAREGILYLRGFFADRWQSAQEYNKLTEAHTRWAKRINAAAENRIRRLKAIFGSIVYEIWLIEKALIEEKDETSISEMLEIGGTYEELPADSEYQKIVLNGIQEIQKEYFPLIKERFDKAINQAYEKKNIQLLNTSMEELESQIGGYIIPIPIEAKIHHSLQQRLFNSRKTLISTNPRADVWRKQWRDNWQQKEKQRIAEEQARIEKEQARIRRAAEEKRIAEEEAQAAKKAAEQAAEEARRKAAASRQALIDRATGAASSVVSSATGAASSTLNSAKNYWWSWWSPAPLPKPPVAFIGEPKARPAAIETTTEDHTSPTATTTPPATTQKKRSIFVVPTKLSDDEIIILTATNALPKGKNRFIELMNNRLNFLQNNKSTSEVEKLLKKIKDYKNQTIIRFRMRLQASFADCERAILKAEGNQDSLNAEDLEKIIIPEIKQLQHDYQNTSEGGYNETEERPKDAEQINALLDAAQRKIASLREAAKPVSALLTSPLPAATSETETLTAMTREALPQEPPKTADSETSEFKLISTRSNNDGTWFPLRSSTNKITLAGDYSIEVTATATKEAETTASGDKKTTVLNTTRSYREEEKDYPKIGDTVIYRRSEDKTYFSIPEDPKAFRNNRFLKGNPFNI